MSRPLSRRGVTLLEAVLAVVILSVAMVATSLVIGPSFQSATAARISSADVAGRLRLSRQTAIVQQAFVDVELIGRRGRQQLVMTVQPNAFDSGSQSSWLVEPNLQITGTPTKLRFAPTGDADTSLRWTVSAADSQRDIQVQAAGGMIRTP